MVLTLIGLSVETKTINLFLKDFFTVTFWAKFDGSLSDGEFVQRDNGLLSDLSPLGVAEKDLTPMVGVNLLWRRSFHARVIARFVP